MSSTTRSAPRPKTVHRDRPKGVEVALGAGRKALRAWGTLTADVRPGPDFLLVGAKRGGTTSAYFHLLSHRNVMPMFPSARFMPGRRDSKGTHYFASDYDRGERWFRSHFPSVAKRAAVRLALGSTPIVGDASPYCLFHPLAPERAAALLPDARILVALRDPVERTHSAWREQVRNGVETLSFADALAAEPERLAGEEERLVAEPGSYSFAHEFQSYAGQSLYADSLERWFAAYPREQVHVWASEDYYGDTDATVRGILEFLGLPMGRFADVKQLNAAPPSPMEPELRAALVERFADDVARTEALLGRQMPWPNFH